MRFTWTLMVLAALVLASQANLVDDVEKSIEAFRALMPTGSDALHIPQLEPLSIKQLPLNIKFSPLDAKVVASNLQLAGASGFEIVQISQLDDGKLAMSLEVPSVDVSGEYDIDGKVKIGFIKVKLSGHGPLTVMVRGIKADAILDVVEHADGSLHVNDIQIQTWSYDKLNIKLDNLFNGGVMGKTVNTLINQLVPSFIKANKNKMNQLIQSKVKDFINMYLDGVAGNKFGLDASQTEAIEWDVSAEMQEMLDQLAMVVVAAHAEDSTTTLEDQAAKLLEEFKAMMKEGRPDFQIPKLDPAVVEKLAVDVKHGPFNAKIVATDSQVEGVSEFKVNTISQIEGTNKLSVEIEVPDITIAGHFDMKGQVKIITVVHINDEGPLRLNITGVKLAATVDVRANEDGSFNLNDVTIDSWTMESIKIQLDNFLGGGWLGKQGNALFNQIFPALVEKDRANIKAKLEPVIENLFNTYLDGLAGKQSADLAAKLQAISELFRTAMKSGREDFSIPVMDPAVIEQLPIHVNKWPLDAQVVVSNIKITGASDFKLTKISQIVGTKKVAVEFEVPAINAACDYDLESTVKVAFIKFNVNRKGPLEVTLRRLTGSAVAELNVESDDQLSLVGLQLDSWSYDTIEIRVENLISGGFIKRTINKLINKLLPSLLVKPHVEEVTSWASKAGERVISRFMDAVAGRVVPPNLDARATKLLDELQSVMRTGSDKYDMPVMDPTVVDQMSLNIDVGFAHANVTAKEINVHGTSDFIITQISQINNTNQLSIDLQVPTINAYTKFDTFAKVLGIELGDHGTAKVAIKDLNVSATASLLANIDGALTLRELEITAWSTGKITAELENLDTLGMVGKAVSKVINAALPKIVQMKHDKLSRWAEVTAKAVLDKFLTGVAAQSSLPAAIHIRHISPEAHAVINHLAMVAMRAGIAQAA